MRQKVNSIPESVTFPRVNLLNLDKEKPMFNRCWPHFVTSTRRWTKLIFYHEILMSHTMTKSTPSSNFNESNEEKSRYLFQFIEQGKRGKIIAHSSFVDLTSSKEGKNLGTFRFKSEKWSQKWKCSCCCRRFLTIPVTKTQDFSV